MRFRQVGRRALLVELDGDRAVRAAYDLVRRLAGSEVELAAPVDVVPAARTVLVDGVASPERWRSALLGAWEPPDLAESSANPPADHPRAPVTIPVRYDGADLPVVAAGWGCSVDEVVRRHVTASWTVAFCGFAPGFAYCNGEPVLPDVPRRDDPRPEVPAGAVGLAGGYCGIYPTAMPGGWQLIATTTARMFDPERDPPSLLSPGDLVRFEAQP